MPQQEPSDVVRVRDVMVVAPVTAAPDESVQAVIRLMTERRVGAVLIADGDAVAGIFTERDLLRHAAEAPPGWRQRPVADWMTRAPHAIGPDASWEEAVAEMERLHVRHLPVVEDGHFVGIVSARQLIGRRTEHLDRLVGERTAELRRINDLLVERDRQGQRDLRAAGKLLNRLLKPGRPPDWPELTWAVHFRPEGTIGGDYYDFARPDGRHLGVLIADASGHNVAAALVAVMARVAFADAVQTAVRPADVLGTMNERLLGISDERFVTASYGVFDRIDRTFTFANAGHPTPLHFDARSGACHPLDATGFMLGIMPEAAYEEWSVLLGAGDVLVLYSDGVTDCRNDANELFGEERLVNAIRSVARHGAGAVLQRVLAELTEYRGARPPGDDQTLLVAEVRG